MGTSASVTGFGYEHIDLENEMCYKSERDNFGESRAERCEFNPLCEYSNETNICLPRAVSPTKIKERKTLTTPPHSDIKYKGDLLFLNSDEYTSTILRGRIRKR